MNWLHSLWFGYWYPSIKGNGPEDLLATILVAVLSAMLWPRIKAGWKAHHAKLDRNFAALQHIAKHHPDIPPIGHDGHTAKERM